jgi:hypothetical protein
MRQRMTLLAGLLLIGALAFTGLVNAQDIRQSDRYYHRTLAGQYTQMERVQIHGVLERIDGRECTIRTSDNRIVRVMTGPESYWADRGYHMALGQAITVTGWYPEDNKGWLYAGSITGPGMSFSLASASGMPYWVESGEQDRTSPSYAVYREWYGAQYNYNPPARLGPRNPDLIEYHDYR